LKEHYKSKVKYFKCHKFGHYVSENSTNFLWQRKGGEVKSNINERSWDIAKDCSRHKKMNWIYGMSIYVVVMI